MKNILSLFFILGFSVVEGCCCKPGCCCGSNSNCCKPIVRQRKKNPTVISSKTTNTINKREQKSVEVKKEDLRDVKEAVKDAYAKVAQSGNGSLIVGVGGDDISHYLGYSKQELDKFADANLGLGCGNIVKIGDFCDGDVVLDLGAGAGLDSFLVAKKVGPTGMVLGVDITPEMINRARKNALKYNITNVEFRLGDIENLPIASDSINAIISNCVINLAPDKDLVFKEAFRVLKKGGRMYVTDTVLLGELSSQQKNDLKLLCACVAGALPRQTYFDKLLNAGFEVTILDENKEISKEWFGRDLPVVSISYVARKK